MQTTTGLDLKLRRIRAGVRQYEVAARVGLTATSLCEFENGRRQFPPERAESIARAIDELAGRKRAEAPDALPV